MPRNVYFSQGNLAEQHLFEDLQIEALKIYGQEVYYLPRKIITRDVILNEDVESYFDDAYMIEMYPEEIEGFGGEGNLMSKFGLEIRDEVTFVVARRSWNKLVGLWNNTVDNDRPNEGDLLYLPLTGSFFEISFVEHEQPFYQLQNVPVYKLQCRLFEYNSEDFNTGLEVIDEIEKEHANTRSVLVTDITGDIEKGMRLYQIISKDANGDAEKWLSFEVAEMSTVGGVTTSLQLELFDFQTNSDKVHNLILSADGDTDTYFMNGIDANTGKPNILDSTVYAKLYEIYDIDDSIDVTFGNDGGAQNYDFEQEGDSVIDFSERNPFGEPGQTIASVTAQANTNMDSTTVLMDSTEVTMDEDS